MAGAVPRRVGVALLALALLAACSSGGQERPAPPVETDRVSMAKSYRFDPPVARVAVGATVTWTNDDNFTHDVHLLEPVEWRSRPLRPGERVSYTFQEPGTYRYECSFHPHDMRGTVVVGP